MQNSAFWTRITSLLWVPDLTCRFVHAIQRNLQQKYSSLYGSQPFICGFCVQNSDFWSRITCLCGSQTSPVILCVQNSVMRLRLYGSKTSPVIFACKTACLCIRITSLYGSQTSSVVFGCKTATLGPDLQVCMGPRPHLWFWAHLTACLAQE